ncbi:pilus assembly PilX N-terminal domain-containing protein [Oceanisphaera sp.]|uniref:pilus assembly PilX N-terminal domain-containing protein n=1 Tax=Oceanisphaera sp. TaxID=1929979 RepID=UPI003A94D15D
MKGARGFTTLTITLMLVSILMTVSLFTGKVLLADRRITLNEIEYRVAHAAAEQGLAEAMAILKQTPATSTWSGAISHAVAEVNYQVTMTPDASLAGVIHLESVATLPSGGESRVRAAVARRSILNPENSGPAAPLILAGPSNELNGRISLVAYPDGGGPGVPLSLWSRGPLTVSGQLQSCNLVDFEHAGNNCTLELSHKSSASEEINDDMVIHDDGFPDDLLAYVLGYGQEQWSSIAAMATRTVSGCDEVDRAGFFIVTGGGDCELEQVTSSAQAPVILLAKDISVSAQMNTRFYGLLLLFDSDTSNSSPMLARLAQGTQIFGGVLSNLKGSQLQGDFAIIYHQGVQCLLSNCDQSSRSPFVSLNRIPGSWTDD